MFVIVEIAGQQFKVEKGKSYFVHRLPQEVNEKVSFNKVLLVYKDEKDIKIGTSIIDGVTVDATIVEHLKGDKVIVFKKKRRKGYRVKNGHRQFFTKIMIDEINLTGTTKKKTVVKKETPESAETTTSPVGEKAE